LETQISSLRAQLKTFPKEDFFCTHNGKYYKWYQTDGKTQQYIPKKKRQLAEKLAAKKYLSLLCEDLEQEKLALSFYLRHHTPHPWKSENLLINAPEYNALLSPFFTPTSQELLDWVNAPYESNTKYPEQLLHATGTGHMVRSKSEAIISILLQTHRIPFRYECALHLDEITLFPDFTIRHPKTGQFFYWEHFGLMDNPGYCQNTCSKLQLYASHGIIPSIHLITTYETKAHPLRTDMVEKIVTYYFS